MNRPKHPSATPRQAAVKIVTVLAQAGHTAYLAGGCVRDQLLGLDPKDYDVATDATPQQVAKLFRKTQFVGEAFGVVLVKLMGHSVEVATFRTEWGYEDGRRPSEIQFSDAQNDAQRRDFTINGLFEDPLTDDPARRIIDYVGGQTDLRQRIVRAIGDPEQRFAEDYLRMLRAVRFAARYGFVIEPATRAAIVAHAPKLGQISRERIGQEVQMMLSSSGAAAACQLMGELTLDGPVLDEPADAVKLTTLWRLSPQADYPTTLAAWLLDRRVIHGRPADDLASLRVGVERNEIQLTVLDWRTALCLSNDQRDGLRDRLLKLPEALRWDDLGKAGRKRLLAARQWPAVRQLLNALGDNPAVTELAKRIDAQAQPLLDEGVAPIPLMTGSDLIALGLKPGPRFKSLLDQVYDAQLELRIHTRQQALELAETLAR